MHTGFKDIPQPVEPTIIQRVVNFTEAIPDIVKSKVQFAPNDVYEERLRLCHTCYFWKEDGNMGMGMCRHPKCGCSKGKLKLSVSKCPIEVWGAWK